MMIQRWLHRYGFGIQSPWAYELVRNVLYEPLRYYAFDELKAKYPQRSKKQRKLDEQLFRIVNHFKPETIEIVGNADAATMDYIEERQKGSKLSTFNFTPPKGGWGVLIYYLAPSAPLPSVPATLSDGMVLVVDDIQATNKAAWEQLLNHSQVTAIFDMGYRGLLCCDAKRVRQTYLL